MINEELTNNSDWKNKLDELESIAGGTFNKEASWNTLYMRLEPAYKNKKQVWYWVAAAGVLVTLSIFFFLPHKKENTLVANKILQKKVDSTFSHLSMINNDTLKQLSILLNKNKTMIYSNGNKVEIHTSINHRMIKPQNNYNIKSKEEIIAKQLFDEATKPVDTIITIAVTLPEKKKLKVVYLNELGEPLNGDPNIARSAARRAFQIKFINQDANITSSHFANTKELKNFTTINLSSN